MSDFDKSIRQGILIIPLLVSLKFILHSMEIYYSFNFTYNFSTLATIEYQKVVWAVAFRVLEEALPIDSMHKSNFINVRFLFFFDLFYIILIHLSLSANCSSTLALLLGRSNCWAEAWNVWLCIAAVTVLNLDKRLLVCSDKLWFDVWCTFSFILECFDTYQLRPLHLKYALSVYTTCVFRGFVTLLLSCTVNAHVSEIQEGGEFAYAINKTFEQEFQKLLNV